MIKLIIVFLKVTQNGDQTDFFTAKNRVTCQTKEKTNAPPFKNNYIFIHSVYIHVTNAV